MAQKIEVMVSLQIVDVLDASGASIELRDFADADVSADDLGLAVADLVATLARKNRGEPEH